MPFPTDFIDLLTDETKALLYLATTMPDGPPQVSTQMKAAQRIKI